MFRAMILAASLAVVSGCSLEPMPRPTVLGPSGALVPVPLSGTWVLHSLIQWGDDRLNESVVWAYGSGADCAKDRDARVEGLKKLGGKVLFMDCQRLGR